MALTPNSRLGPYEILAPLGAGGMGEVYRARDTRLGRDVAVKVLPEHLSSNPDLRARFEREARTVSSLNHPHICTLHDIGRAPGGAGSGDIDFLVMELVEGETLADRLAKGPLPTPEVLRIGIDIADALDRAHRAGIVHRDLKPGNIMLAKSGAKLMDFGLARAAEIVQEAGSLAQSPTMTRALTAEGAIVGTFQYMAPEQLDGGESDARADIWALGATLYEMVTGTKAFAGRSQAGLIASILKEEPRPLAQGPGEPSSPGTPPSALDQVIRACLTKDPEERIQTAHDVKLQLQWIAAGGSQSGVAAPVAARRRSREKLAWAVAGVALAAVAALAALVVMRRPEPPRVMRFEVDAPDGVTSIGWPRMSPDGRLLAFLASDSSGVARIWVRPLDALEAHPLSGTEGAGRPFWSPDSRFLAYISQGKLRKAPVAGGPPVTLADTPGGSDGTWGVRGVILFDGGLTDSIHGVPEGGGEVRHYTHLDAKSGDVSHGWPYFLPDGQHFLFLASRAGQTGGNIMLGKVGSNAVSSVGAADGRVEYAPPGYLVFPREGSLMAQPFDLRSLKTTGDAVPVGENLSMGNAAGQFSVSMAGMLAYRSERGLDLSQLMWFDRNGRALGDAGAPGAYRDIALSPDGSRVVMSIFDPQRGSEDLWVRQIARGVTSRLTFDPGDEILPVWSPDGERVAYAADRTGTFRTYIRLASGVGEVDSLADVVGHGAPTSWSPDGSTIAAHHLSPTSGWDVWLVPTAPGSRATPFVATPFRDLFGTFSPDGRWLAFESSESGRPEIYIQATNGTQGKWQVSNAGGTKPWWRADGREIVYQALDQTLTAVPVTAGDRIETGTPVPLFRANLVTTGYNGRRWSLTADARKFLVNSRLSAPDRANLTVVTNWTSEFERR